MTDTDLVTTDAPGAPAVETPTAETAATADVAAGDRARSTSLTSMVLPELRALAKQIGVEGASGMRKSELIAAIRERRESNGAKTAPADSAPEKVAEQAAEQPAEKQAPPRRERRGAARRAGAPETDSADTAQPAPAEAETPAAAPAPETKAAPENTESAPEKAPEPAEAAPERSRQDKPANDDNKGDRGRNRSGDQSEGKSDNKNDGRGENRGDNRNDGGGDRQRDDQQGRGNRNNANNSNNNSNDDDDDGDGRQGRRGRRFRDRRRRGERGSESGGGGGGDRDTELRDDDVVQPVAGILDVLDNYAFVRTSGYLAGPNDVYVSMNMVRKNGLRRGDAVTGAVRVPKEGDGGGQNQRQKFNPLVRLDTVNGGPVEDAKKRPEFSKLTPLYPNQRLRLETTPERLTTRVIDLIMPIGKGQRALIVSPPKAGKTTIMQDIANAITRNNPECHLMVVLVDERPEEVTDMQRSVKGEVIASTFDRPPSDHTQAAELAIERAKRLVEQGKDVVVLLDSITRLGRAYNNASPASGRILSGGVDSTALYPPKRFLGAARNIEHGGSLTIIATAMVETGSTGDTVIFEEFKGTGNAELKLDRKIAERRVFPAVDVNPSGTRKDELLLSPDEFAVVHKLRRVLSGLDSHQAIDLLMSQLRKTKTNYEFLVQVSKTAPGSADHD
ncbi:MULTISPECIES: transcription termination factor Rho [Mycobacteriaceae]|uniref:transcription termination factor Rho n=1 Tax=Mycobacteriaceae TaxID=1762 RepID=UPI0007FF3CA4|nr:MULTISPECIES: transcription termination factor Rho [Mycobacteriaceae]MCK0173223.1 transcription termination factor Rho [Mycolicibacterium sp. F2034L]OBB61193.1 transcription termination factor Rho [Mycobacterium sp. 852013-51886_SCH5428379]